jgi:DNA-binding GntR family transcriptional regulator
VTLQEHERIFAALDERNGENAADAMVRHLDAVNSELEVLAKSRPEIFADRELWEAKPKRT